MRSYFCIGFLYLHFFASEISLKMKVANCIGAKNMKTGSSSQLAKCFSLFSIALFFSFALTHTHTQPHSLTPIHTHSLSLSLCCLSRSCLLISLNVYPGVRTLRALNCQNELLADEKKARERERKKGGERKLKAKHGNEKETKGQLDFFKKCQTEKVGICSFQLINKKAFLLQVFLDILVRCVPSVLTANTEFADKSPF